MGFNLDQIQDFKISENFSFLNDKFPELAILASFSEEYLHSDPQTSAVKLRLFIEKFVQIIFEEFGLAKPPNEGLFAIMDEPAFKDSIPPLILSILHKLRINGNKAAHTSQASSKLVLELVKDAHNLGRWLLSSIYGVELKNTIDYKPTTAPTQNQKVDYKYKKKLAEKEQQIGLLQKELSEKRKQIDHREKTHKELTQFKKDSSKLVNELDFDEEQTRQLLIEDMLVDSGFDVGDKGKNTDEVGQEVKVLHQPTKTGEGFADYVIWNDDGEPLAVIEAKKTSKDPDLGKEQAKIYADGLEKMYNQRPIIFYTNGFDIFIWNDSNDEPPRKVYGYYSKDSLQYIHFQNKNKLPSKQMNPDHEIVDRMCNYESVKRVLERFSEKQRKALIVQATGTGKTRVAIALCKAMIEAKWAKRILFLCDRKELRKQAKNTFTEYLPDEPLTIVSNRTAKDREKRVYLSTYPAMLKCFQTFDVGFFDLIIADESHRSIYNVYRDIFTYFDAYQVGLTATPVQFINRNTYALFNCPTLDPTAYFSYEDAITNDPPYLVPFEVYTHQTKFQREGIQYFKLNKEQQLELEDQVSEPETIDFTASQIDKQIFNKDTNREIIRNLMEYGIRDKEGMLPGKTIIFARSHKHALVLRDMFDEMYPQYGGKYCRVIDNYDPRAEQLIDDFKGFGKNKELTIAISVDMLDTGIDVPEIVNLVFAKPVRSYVKFWQMIGRGTRLCKNLFGAGKDKTKFRIFDLWGNFEWFGEEYSPIEPGQSKPLMQKLFETRIDLAESAINKSDQPTFNMVKDHMLNDIYSLKQSKTIAVKEKSKEIREITKESVIDYFSAKVKNHLRNEIAPLMQWRNLKGKYPAYKFDLLMTIMQYEFMVNNGHIDEGKCDELVDSVHSLPKNINPVKLKSEVVKKVMSPDFWDDMSVKILENVRKELRGLMKYLPKETPPELTIPTIDITEDVNHIEHKQVDSKIEPLNLVNYRERVDSILKQLIDESPALQKIKSGKSITKKDIEALQSLILTQAPDMDLRILLQIFPETTGDLGLAIRRLIGLDSEFVNECFADFVHSHPELDSTQIKFITMVKNHICKYGAIKLERLYETPFITLHSDGIDGIFENEKQNNEVLQIIQTINNPDYKVGKMI